MAERSQSELTIDTKNVESLNLESRFTDLYPVGYGASGLVYAATDREGDKKVAIKKIAFHDPQTCCHALREVRIMQRIDHENVVTVHEILGSDGSTLTPDADPIESIYIVQELLDTDLTHLIQGGQLTAEHSKFFLYQLLRGIKYIHSANVLHRDLKPSNLLVNCEDLVLKIGDFGLARIVDPQYSHKGFLTENVGTSWYRSPELLLSPNDYTKAIDIWSVGCIFAEMLLGRPLFTGANELDQVVVILDAVYLEDEDWDAVFRVVPNKALKNHPLRPGKPLGQRLLNTNIESEGLDLLERLLNFGAKERITAEEALAHPYFREYYCAWDEPVAQTPFHIEHEVDELSLGALRQLIVQESVASRCGSIPGQAMASDMVNVEDIRSETDGTHTLEEILCLESPQSEDDCSTDANRSQSPEQIATMNQINLQLMEDRAVQPTPDILTAALEEEAAPFESHIAVLLASDAVHPEPAERTITKPDRKAKNYVDEEKDVADFSLEKLLEDEELAATSVASCPPSTVASCPPSTVASCPPSTVASCPPSTVASCPPSMIADNVVQIKPCDTPCDSPVEGFDNASSAASGQLKPLYVDVSFDHWQDYSHLMSRRADNGRDKSPEVRDCRSLHRTCGTLCNHCHRHRCTHTQEASRTRVVRRRYVMDEENLKERIGAEKNRAGSQKFEAERRVSEKKCRRRHSKEKSSTELDELYRLPTEHLRIDRDYSNQKLKDKWITELQASYNNKCNEEINEIIREEGHVNEGACGGTPADQGGIPADQAEEQQTVVYSTNLSNTAISWNKHIENEFKNQKLVSLSTKKCDGLSSSDSSSSPEQCSSPQPQESRDKPKKSPRKQKAL